MRRGLGKMQPRAQEGVHRNALRMREDVLPIHNTVYDHCLVDLQNGHGGWKRRRNYLRRGAHEKLRTRIMHHRSGPQAKMQVFPRHRSCSGARKPRAMDPLVSEDPHLWVGGKGTRAAGRCPFFVPCCARRKRQKQGPRRRKKPRISESSGICPPKHG